MGLSAMLTLTKTSYSYRTDPDVPAFEDDRPLTIVDDKHSRYIEAEFPISPLFAAKPQLKGRGSATLSLLDTVPRSESRRCRQFLVSPYDR